MIMKSAPFRVFSRRIDGKGRQDRALEYCAGLTPSNNGDPMTRPAVFARNCDNDARNEYIVTTYGHLASFMENVLMRTLNPEAACIYELFAESTPVYPYFDVELTIPKDVSLCQALACRAAAPHNSEVSDCSTEARARTLLAATVTDALRGFAAFMAGRCDVIDRFLCDSSPTILDASCSDRLSQHVIVRTGEHMLHNNAHAGAYQRMLGCFRMAVELLVLAGEPLPSPSFAGTRPMDSQLLLYFDRTLMIVGRRAVRDAQALLGMPSSELDVAAFDRVAVHFCGEQSMIDPGVYTRNRIFRVPYATKKKHISPEALQRKRRLMPLVQHGSDGVWVRDEIDDTGVSRDKFLSGLASYPDTPSSTVLSIPLDIDGVPPCSSSSFKPKRAKVPVPRASRSNLTSVTSVLFGDGAEHQGGFKGDVTGMGYHLVREFGIVGDVSHTHSIHSDLCSDGGPTTFYYTVRNRMCPLLQREHQSNHSYIRFDRFQGIADYCCHDPNCIDRVKSGVVHWPREIVEPPTLERFGMLVPF